MWNLGVCESLVPQYYLRKFIPKKICYRDRPMPNKKGVRVGCPKIHCYITMFTHFPWFSPHEQCHFQAHHGPPSQIPSTTAPATKWHLALQRAPWRGVKQALLKELVQGGRATCRWSHWKKNKLTNWLVVSTPLKNMKSVGITIPNIWKKLKMFQTTNQLIFCIRTFCGAFGCLEIWGLEFLNLAGLFWNKQRYFSVSKVSCGSRRPFQDGSHV